MRSTRRAPRGRFPLPSSRPLHLQGHWSKMSAAYEGILCVEWSRLARPRCELRPLSPFWRSPEVRVTSPGMSGPLSDFFVMLQGSVAEISLDEFSSLFLDRWAEAGV